MPTTLAFRKRQATFATHLATFSNIEKVPTTFEHTCPKVVGTFSMLEKVARWVAKVA